MKLAVVILACMAAVAVQSMAVHKDHVKFADKAFLEKQKFFFEILKHVDGPLLFGDWIKFGEKLITDESHYQLYDEWMTKFYDSYKVGGLLAHGDYFSAVNKHHIHQAWGLFNFFYYAKDWETFAANVVWARINVNEGMFVYALTLAVIHREDMHGIMLPQIYEIFPQLFFNSKFVMEAEKFDWATWNKEMMYEKQYMTIYEKKHVKDIHGKYWYMKDWKMWQWWKLMGLDEEWHLEEKCVLRENVDILKNDSKWTALWSSMKMLWMPVDYSRDIETLNEEAKLSYFTEDLGWNAFWYYLNMDYAPILDSKHFHLSKDRRGEWWIFMVQQIMARYYMERLSHGLGDIDEFTWHGHFETGYDPQLVAYNGVAFSMRKNYWDIESHENVELWNKIVNLDHRIDNAIASGKFVTKDGVSIELWKPEAVEHIGNIMQGNVDIVDKAFFGYWLSLSSLYLSGEGHHDMDAMPSTFSNFETMMRDPLYYHLLKRVIHVLHSFKEKLPAYTHDELFLKDVTIKDVEVDKMMTYFDLVDFDASNLLNHVEEDDKSMWGKTLLARQMRLNHKPFVQTITVLAEKAQKVLIRTFLGPDRDEYDEKINLMHYRDDIMRLDTFVYDLVAGENVIKRSSNDFYLMNKDHTTYTELYKLVMMAYEGKYELPLDISQPHCGFPMRLLLPRGWVKGMPMKMFYIITPYEDSHEHLTFDSSYLCGIGSGSRFADHMPFGYPFDRKIDNYSEFFMPNMFWKDVKIYHVDKFEKYYEHKYEHLGHFDYSFN